jgi:hypothetical protein
MDSFSKWLNEVRGELLSINMPIDDWQKTWVFDFEREFKAGTTPSHAAAKANRFWWHQQNKSMHNDCQSTRRCWLPRGHQGECEDTSQ